MGRKIFGFSIIAYCIRLINSFLPFISFPVHLLGTIFEKCTNLFVRSNTSLALTFILPSLSLLQDHLLPQRTSTHSPWLPVVPWISFLHGQYNLNWICYPGVVFLDIVVVLNKVLFAGICSTRGQETGSRRELCCCACSCGSITQGWLDKI